MVFVGVQELPHNHEHQSRLDRGGLLNAHLITECSGPQKRTWEPNCGTSLFLGQAYKGKKNVPTMLGPGNFDVTVLTLSKGFLQLPYNPGK